MKSFFFLAPIFLFLQNQMANDGDGTSSDHSEAEASGSEEVLVTGDAADTIEEKIAELIVTGKRYMALSNLYTCSSDFIK